MNMLYYELVAFASVPGILRTNAPSVGNLQHISEREPDDWEEDPSLHPTTETMFMEKSKQAIQSKNGHDTDTIFLLWTVGNQIQRPAAKGPASKRPFHIVPTTNRLIPK